jgi:DNA-binding HxlR family transcriptional regulator
MTAANYHIAGRDYFCPVELTLSAIGGKWKVLILWKLMDGTMRYSELRRALGDITHKMLAQQLRELEADGLIVRTAYPVIPPRVEYSLSAAGNRIRPVIAAMSEWGMAFGEPMAEAAAG